MQRALLATVFLITLFAGADALAGFGGMHEVGDGSPTSLSDLVWGGLIFGGIYWLWQKFF